MKKTFRRILCLVLCVLTLSTLLLPAAAQAPKEGTYSAFSWTMDENTLTVFGTGVLTYSPGQTDALEGTYENLVIGEGITQIGFRALDMCSSAGYGNLGQAYIPR